MGELFSQNGDTLEATKWYQAGREYLEQNKYDSAVYSLEIASEAYESASAWKALVKSQHALGNALVFNGQREAGKMVFEAAFEIAESHFSESHHLMALSLFLVANSQEKMNAFVPAKKSLTQAIAHWKQVPQSDLAYADLADAYRLFGDCERRLGHLDAADSALQIGLALMEDNGLAVHLVTGKIFNALGIVSIERQDYTQAVDYLQRRLRLLESGEFPVSPRELAGANGNLYVVSFRQGNLHVALDYLNRTLEIQKANLPPADPQIAMSYNNMGGALLTKGDYEGGRKVLFQAIDIYLKKGMGNHLGIALAYFNLGMVYTELGDFDQALHYLQQSLKIRKDILGPAHYLVGFTYNQIGLIYRDRGSYTEARDYLKRAFDITSPIFPNGNEEGAWIYNNLGICEMDEGNLTLAKDYFSKSLGEWEKVLSKDHYKTVPVWMNLGICAGKENDTTQGRVYLEKALELQASYPGYHQERTVRIHAALGGIYRKMKAYDQALDQFHKAKVVLKRGKKSFEEVPHVHNFLLQVIELEAGVWEEKGGSKMEMKGFLASLEEVIGVIDRWRISFKATGSKQVLAGQAMSIYEKTIEVALELFQQTQDPIYLQTIFACMEKGKSILLLETLKTEEALQFAGIPDSLLQFEKRLQVDMAYFEKKLFEEGLQPDLASEKLAEWEDRYFHLKQSHDSLISVFESHFPAYFSLKYSQKPANISDIQNRLRVEKATLVSYFQGDSALYVFSITPHSIYVHKIPDERFYRAYLKDFVKSLGDRANIMEEGSSPNAIRRFAGVSHSIYQMLLAPVLDHSEPQIAWNSPTFTPGFTPQKLIIVPDGFLGYLPFEVLISRKHSFGKEDDFGDLPYLIRDYDISYAYSATLMMEEVGGNGQSTSRYFGGYAPDYQMPTSHDGWKIDTSISLSPLRFNQGEVAKVAQLLNGDAFLAKEATEGRFKSEASKYQLLHLAMHAFTRDDQPMYAGFAFHPDDQADSLATEDGFLHAYELYNMRLNAELAILSACNTGVGKLQRGEGLMSLSRAFRYAGCPNVVMSLWQADDASTSVLMNRFYQHLQSGMPKDKALRQAKLDFLATSERLHPYFWGTFVLLGDGKPVSEKGTDWPIWAWVLMALGILGVGGWWKWRSKK